MSNSDLVTENVLWLAVVVACVFLGLHLITQAATCWRPAIMDCSAACDGKMAEFDPIPAPPNGLDKIRVCRCK